jgi:hypothetical protein
MLNHMAGVSPRVGRTYSQETNIQSSVPLTSVLTFDFDTEERQYQAFCPRKWARSVASWH